LVVGDLEQAEDRWVVWESEDEAAMEAYLSGEDQHVALAVAIFGEIILEYQELNKILFKRYRDVSKMGAHARNYGQGWSTYRNEVLGSMRIWLEASEAKRIIRISRGMRPMLGNYHLEIRTQLRDTRSLETVFGRKRTFYGAMNDATFREAYAYKPQSTVSDITKRATIVLDKEQPWMQFLADNHDSNVYQAPEEREDEAVVLLKNAMEIPLEVKGRAITIPVSIQTGRSWGDLSSWKPKVVN